jgi:hypothetical protein
MPFDALLEAEVLRHRPPNSEKEKGEVKAEGYDPSQPIFQTSGLRLLSA